MTIRTRFAPSPTGFMHVGNLRTALYAYLFARHNGGKFILRIEDTDRERYVDGSVEVIYDTLKRSGIEPDEGPNNPGDCGPYVQSERRAIYKKYADKLVEAGGAYYCFCKKERVDSLKDENGVGKYDKHCLSIPFDEAKRRIADGEKYVVRQNISPEGESAYTDMIFGKITVPNADMEDGVLLKSDGMPTYNFANVVDDHLMGITHVIRGVEYLSSTPKYNLIYDAFGWQRPEYMHLAPIMKDCNRKLSKRYGDANFEDFAEKGFLPEAIINYISLLGWSPDDNTEKMTLDELIEKFDVKGISKSPSIFDETKMRWLNGLYLKEMSAENFDKIAGPYYKKSAIYNKYDTLKFSELLKSRVEILSEIPDMVAFINEFGYHNPDLYFHKKMKVNGDVAKKALASALEYLSPLDDFSAEKIRGALLEAAEKEGLTKGQILFTVRLGVTGKAATPGGAVEMADILGKEETLRRLKVSVGILESAGKSPAEG